MSKTNVFRPVAAMLLSSTLFGVQTRTWSQGDFADFEKAHLTKVSLRSDGRLTLAPVFAERFDSSSAYLWAAAVDSKGTLYAGGGPGAKLYRMTAAGEKKTLAELEGLQVQAIAIDKQDRVYAATAPDGKVYRVGADGKATVFYDPKAKYIWALAFNSKGDLFVATGDRGELHRVTADGKGAVFFKTDETHARSLAVDSSDNLILGTEPGGLVLRVSPSGEGFVLYQMSKKEVTAVAVHNGTIYASAAGSRGASRALTISTIPPVAPPSDAPAASAGGGTAMRVTNAPNALLAPPPPVSVAGGSEFYQIDPSGNPHKLWSHAQDVVYAIAFDADGRALLGTGNRGIVYRVDSESLFTVLLKSATTQVTGFAGRNGKLFAITGNAGKVFELGPGLEKEGEVESEPFDSSSFSQWGRLTYEGSGAVSIAVRSGNVDQPQKNWSQWAGAVTDPKGARLAVPAARFAQWKATLRGDAEVREVDMAYLAKNVEPKIELVEVTPANYRFPSSSVTVTPTTPTTLNLPALGKSAGPATLSIDTGGASSTMNYGKGFLGARWNAADANGDPLIYALWIRGVKETGWKLLKDKIREKQYSWDSTAFADGEYKLKLVASDAPGNPPGDALTAEMESDTFIVDNTAPAVSGLTAARDGGAWVARWKAADALNNLKKAEYSLDGGEWTMVLPVGGLSDSLELDYELRIPNAAAGEHALAVRVVDDYDNVAVRAVTVR